MSHYKIFFISILMAVPSSAAYGSDNKFRYEESSNSCLMCKKFDRHGNCLEFGKKSGMNPGFIGECGDLTGKIFTKVNWEWKSLRGANLRRAKFADSKLSHAIFTGANLTGARFVRPDCYECIFKKSILDNAKMFDRANLRRANFVDASMTGIQLYGAKLIGARFYGANLLESRLADADLSFAHCDETTKLPFERIEALKRGMVFSQAK